MKQDSTKPDFILEAGWEVCNQEGAVHTMLSTKAEFMKEAFGQHYVLFGPDVYRESIVHPEFEEDNYLFAEWKKKAGEEGLRIRTGYWKTHGKPATILVDFTPYFAEKNAILSGLWEKFSIDSISGGWDYIEPTLFGYATGKVIESFVRFHLSPRDRVIAHFHDWTSGAGLLYVKDKLPGVANVFTIHSHIMGRTLIAHGKPIYSSGKILQEQPSATDLGIKAPHSLEQIVAHQADSYTTVSKLSSGISKKFLQKPADYITPNGIHKSFRLTDARWKKTRALSRALLFKTATALTGIKYPEDTFILGTSARNDFHNKGIDVFLDVLKDLNEHPDPINKPLLAFIQMPYNNYGSRKDLQINLSREHPAQLKNNFITHYLHDEDNNPVVKKILDNKLDDPHRNITNIFFVPAQLNGSDGIFNCSYFDLLAAFDLSVFPSLYEPWGYSAHESICYGIPTITTNLSGFGEWAGKRQEGLSKYLAIIERTEENYTETTNKISASVKQFYINHREKTNNNLHQLNLIIKDTLWENQADMLFKTYDAALQKVRMRKGKISKSERVVQIPLINRQKMTNQPIWKKLLIKKTIPQGLQPLDALSKNLWWSWNHEAIDLFKEIDPELWKKSEENALNFLENLSYNQLVTLDQDSNFKNKLKKVYDDFNSYMAEAKYQKDAKVAYFSMEYGIHDSLKIYSGGLGVLAGDYLKEASDYNYNLVGIGLFYRYGYFKQVLSASGEQIANYEMQIFDKTPAQPFLDKNGKQIKISIQFPGRTVFARVWRVNVGRIPLLLLDTDFEDNQDADRTISYHLYGGDNENRLKQELLLGVGGIRALQATGYAPDLYHCNEGHAAFIGLERLRGLIVEKNMTYPEALEVVRATSLFTTHTPVPAGHDFFTEDLLRTYIAHYPERLQITWKQLMSMGKIDPDNNEELFSMSHLAANLSQEINGVSRLHGKVSQQILKDLWQGYYPDELHIDYVTNGVHLPTWISKEWLNLYAEHLDKNFLQKQDDHTTWEKIHEVDDKIIWDTKNKLRKSLIEYIKQRLSETALSHTANPRVIIEAQEKINPKTLTIGFARRFATYKRAQLLFTDAARLSRIVNNPEMPVQFIFAGKAHPQDKQGQELIRKIIEISRQPEFTGKIVFLQNYEMGLAKQLVQGVDIWLNTPTRPLEASGTSGEKVVMNGGIHFSVLDGWWAEGYTEGAGWALTETRHYENQEIQNELDAETIYNILENEICPLYYQNRNKENVPEGWVKVMKNSISQVAPNFTMNRQLIDYHKKFYKGMYSRSQKIQDNDFALVKEICTWKKRVSQNWDKIEVLEVNHPELTQSPISVGETYKGSVKLNLDNLTPEDLGLEMLISSFVPKSNNIDIIEKADFKLESFENKTATFSITYKPSRAGIFQFGIRLYPWHAALPHRQDFNYVKWI